MKSDPLLEELADFLRMSATNVEWMSDQLRTALNVPTGLEDVVRAAIREGQTVVVAGTAGSGKTHLLHSLGGIAGYTIIGDLAALPEEKWPSIFTSGKTIVAGNEGAFLQGSRKGFPGFDQVVSLLHAIQKGEDPQDGGPVVIDAAGFDPAGSHVISHIVRLELLRRYAARLGGLAAASWEMFSDELVRQRLGILVESASAETGADGFTFRQLWQFVGDMLNVRHEQNVPWFDRVFQGDSEVARRISQAFSPLSVPLPHIGNRLWHADLMRLKPAFLESAASALEQLLSAMLHERESARRLVLFRSLRALAIFGLKNSPIDQMLGRAVDLWAKVRALESLSLLQAINRYFVFDLIDLGDDLELWLQHETERHLLKPEVQISLGAAKVAEFCIRRSNVIANRPMGVNQLQAGRFFLVHRPTGAVLSVTKDLVEGLLQTRSHRTNERKDVEYDWRIGRFFEQVARRAATPDRLRAAAFDFQARRGRLLAWQVSSDRVRRVAN